MGRKDEVKSNWAIEAFPGKWIKFCGAKHFSNVFLKLVRLPKVINAICDNIYIYVCVCVCIDINVDSNTNIRTMLTDWDQD